MLWSDPRLPPRFWTKVQAVPFTGCWIWTAATCGTGYGTFFWLGRHAMAHRVTRSVLVGDLEVWSTDRTLDVVDHLCRVKACVNPSHVEPVTQAENLKRCPSWSGQQPSNRADRNAAALAAYHRRKGTINPRRNAKRRDARRARGGVEHGRNGQRDRRGEEADPGAAAERNDAGGA